MAKVMAVPEFVEIRHRQGCAAKGLEPGCVCTPGVRGAIYVDGKKQVHAIKGRRPTADRADEAHRWALKSKEFAQTGRLLQLERRTIDSTWQDWLAKAASGEIQSNREDSYKRSTLERWRAGMVGHTLPALGALDLKALTPRRLRELVKDLRVESKLSASAIRNCVVPLSTMYRWAVEEDMVEINPCLGVRLPAQKRKDIVVPTFEQQDQMLDAAQRADAKVLWALAFYAGARRGEALGLKWDMVDLENGTIRFERTWNPDQYIKEFKEGVKTRAGNRPIPMVGPLTAILREHRAATGRLAGFVFSQSPDDPWDGHWPVFYRKVQAEVAKDKLPRLTFHDCRHVYASRIIRAAAEAGENVDWNEIAMLMGHTSVAFTIDTYAHLAEDYLERHRKYQDDYYQRHSG